MKSAVAAVLDGYGGWHVVVAPRRGLRHHVQPGQLLLVVPDFKVQEPVPWEQVPWIIARVERHIEWWVGTRNDPDTLRHPAVALYKLRKQRTYQRGSVNLCDIVET